MKPDYPMRSLMFVPAHNDKLMKSASRTNADILLLDLEDSVQPLCNKQVARDKIKEAVASGMFSQFHLFPRVNDRESGELLRDITQLTIDGIDGFVYPKAKTGSDIYFFDKLLETVEYEKGIPVNTFKIIPLIETASAVLHAEEICMASGRVIAVAFGNEDYLTDLQGTNDAEASPLFTPRALIAMAARSANVLPIDTVHINVHDLNDLEKNIITAKKLGFEGMLVLHPKELDLVHSHYSPADEEIAEAKIMVEAFEESSKKGEGVAIVKGRFVGPPLLKNAFNIIEKHKRILTKELKRGDHD